MAELNLVEKANKVISFRKVIRDICRKKGLEYPSDDKISEYINQKYGMNVDDFIKDYTEHEGIFRDPFTDFKAEIDKYDWVNKPTEEEMRGYITEHGYNVKGFIRQQTINIHSPLERDVLLNVLSKCTTPQLVALWNEFIEESAMYGEDSYIYDLNDTEDLNMLRRNMTPRDWAKVVGLKARYVQWFNLNDGKVQKVDEEDVDGILISIWGDIFPRLLTWTCASYENIGRANTEQRFSHFYDIVVRPILLKGLGYNYDPSKGTIEEIKKD